MKNTLPPLPEGYQLEGSVSTMPPLPEGYIMEGAQSTPENQNGGVLSNLLTHYLNNSMQKGQSLNDAIMDLTPYGAAKNFSKGMGEGIENRALGVAQTVLPKALQPEWMQPAIDQNIHNTQNAGVAQTIGQMVGDPLNFTPMGEAKNFLGVMGQGAKLGALSGLTAPTTEQDSGVLNTALHTAEGAVGGAVIPPTIAAIKGTASTLGKAAINPIETAQSIGRGIGNVVDAVQHPIDTTVDAYKAISGAVIPKMADAYLNYNNTKNGLTSDFAKEGLGVEKQIPGLKFNVGQLTGNQRALTTDDYLSKSIATADQAYEKQKDRINAIGKYVDNLMNKVSKEPTNDIKVGNDIRDTYSNGVSNLIEVRRQQAEKDLHAVDALNNNTPFVTPTNFINVLHGVIENGHGPFASSADRQASTEAKKYLAPLIKDPDTYNAIQKQIETFTKSGVNISPQVQASLDTELQKAAQPIPVTARQLQRGLADFGAAADGGDNIWNRIATAKDREVATAGFGALKSDLDIAAQSMGPESPVAQALQVFRRRYGEASGNIDQIKNSVMGKYLGNDLLPRANQPNSIPPENIATRIRNMAPSQVSELMTTMDKVSPDNAQAVRRYYLESALNDAKAGMNQAGIPASSTYPYDPVAFFKRLPDKDTLNAIFSKDPKMLNQVNAAAQALYRTSVLGPGLGKSPTFNRTELSKLFQHGITQPVQAVKDIARFITQGQMLDMLNDPAQRIKFTAAMKQPNKPESQRVISDIYKRVVPGAVQQGILQGQNPEGVFQFQQQ